MNNNNSRRGYTNLGGKKRRKMMVKNSTLLIVLVLVGLLAFGALIAASVSASRHNNEPDFVKVEREKQKHRMYDYSIHFTALQDYLGYDANGLFFNMYEGDPNGNYIVEKLGYTQAQSTAFLSKTITFLKENYGIDFTGVTFTNGVASIAGFTMTRFKFKSLDTRPIGHESADGIFLHPDVISDSPTQAQTGKANMHYGGFYIECDGTEPFGGSYGSYVSTTCVPGNNTITTAVFLVNPSDQDYESFNMEYLEYVPTWVDTEGSYSAAGFMDHEVWGRGEVFKYNNLFNSTSGKVNIQELDHATWPAKRYHYTSAFSIPLSMGGDRL